MSSFHALFKPVIANSFILVQFLLFFHILFKPSCSFILMMVFFLCCSWSYIFIHYALLVAYVARSSDILTNFLGIPLYEFQLFCYCFSVIETDESIFSVFLTCSLEFCIPLYELCPFTGFSFKGRGNPFMLIAFFFFFFWVRDIPLNELCLVLYWFRA